MRGQDVRRGPCRVSGGMDARQWAIARTVLMWPVTRSVAPWSDAMERPRASGTVIRPLYSSAMESLSGLADVVTTFATQHSLTVIPAVPARDCGPDVIIEPDVLDLPGFLELAGKLCNGVLYVKARPFDPGVVGE